MTEVFVEQPLALPGSANHIVTLLNNVKPGMVSALSLHVRKWLKNMLKDKVL